MSLREDMEAGKSIDWSRFKTCMGCESILSRSSFVCPICHAYRWEYSPFETQKYAEEAVARSKAGESRIPDFEDRRG